ncbi:hypothetical protein Lesp01_56550 [Lentzea sp. NBRC 102530]|nr:hypothetical protein Lesp01_56550 [Lentzea sp. NBRC 102530]
MTRSPSPSTPRGLGNSGINRVDGWIDSALEGVKTETARKVAEAALTVSPLAWRDR